MDGVAVTVGENLHLDVARRADVFFDQHARVAERRLRLAHGAAERRLEVGVALDPAHALAAAAGHRLDQHRIADLVGFLLEELRLLPVAVIAGHHRHTGLLHQRLGAALEPHGAHRRRFWPDENEPGIDAGLREVGVLRKKSVAGMHAVRLGGARGCDQFVDDEIALRSRRRADAVRLVA